MSLIVQKYGGTSVADLDRIESAARKVVAAVNDGHRLVVVVSAMAGETDRLLGLATEAGEGGSAREFASVVSTGEMVSSGLMALTLSRLGRPARSMSGAQAGIGTVGRHDRARIRGIDTARVRRALDEGVTPVLAGFQGTDGQGETTTLGRGGSDTTAVAVAGALGADECRIYTDVDGIFTCDPRIVSTARRLTRIHFEEVLELASLGTKVLNVRAAEYAAKGKVPLRILSSLADDPVGTLVTYEEDGNMEKPVVTGIALNREEAKITLVDVPDRPGIASRIFGDIAEVDIDVDMIIQNIGHNGETNLSFTVQRGDYRRALEVTRSLAADLGAKEVVGDNAIGKLSVVGIGMRSHSGVAGKMFRTLADESINIQMISTSEIKISVVIDEKYLELGARALHSAFGLDGGPEVEQAEPAAG